MYNKEKFSVLVLTSCILAISCLVTTQSPSIHQAVPLEGDWCEGRGYLLPETSVKTPCGPVMLKDTRETLSQPNLICEECHEDETTPPAPPSQEPAPDVVTHGHHIKELTPTAVLVTVYLFVVVLLYPILLYYWTKFYNGKLEPLATPLGVQL